MRLLMTLAVVASLGTVALVATILWRKKQHEAHDTAMTAVMTMGMIVGLTGGVMAGLLIPENLWPPTLIGSLVGMAAGAIVAAPTGVAMLLEGMMSGLMGGTMGAMMGGMMPASGGPLVAFTLVLTVGGTLLSVKALSPAKEPGHDHDHDHGGAPPTGRRPIIPAITALAAAGVGAYLVLGPLVHRLPVQQEHQHGQTVQVAVRAHEYGFDQQVVTVPVGRPVRLQFYNDGNLEHDFTIPGLEYRTVGRTDRRTDPPGLHVFARPGTSSVMEFIPLQPGEYQAYCTVPGHQEQGMVMILKVVGET